MKKRLVFLVLAISLAVPTFARVASQIESSGIKGGLIVHLGCGNGQETSHMLISDRYIVQGLDTSDANIQQARKNIRTAGLYGKVSASKFDGRNLPYVDNLVNLIIATGKTKVSHQEILRVLAPLGVAIINGEKITKPWPDNIDDWNHYLHGPDNNAVINDETIGEPRSVQWVSEPRWGRSHEELASMTTAVSARGRVFFIVDEAPLDSIRFDADWKLIARDAFNGKLLWKKPITKWIDHLRHFRSGPLHLQRRLVAVGETVYVTLALDGPVTAIDAATGNVQKVYSRTDHTEEILIDGQTMYLVVGTSEIDRRGEGLFNRSEPKPTDFRYITAIDIATGKQLWKKDFPADEFLLPTSLTVHGSSVYYQSTAGVGRLDARSGNEAWKVDRFTPSIRMASSGPTVVATDDVLLCADRSAKETDAAKETVSWGVHGWNQKGFPRKAKAHLTAYSVKDGKELWSVPCGEGYNSAVDIFVVDQTVWLGTDYTGYDLKTGTLIKKLEWVGDGVGMGHHRCYRNKASNDYIFTGRSGIEVVSFDEGWQGNNSWVRGTCQYGIMPSNGFLYAPPDSCACFPKVKVEGFFAAAPQRGKDGNMPFPKQPIIEKGPAYGKVKAARTATADWPMYRADYKRSGSSRATVASSLKKQWSTPIDGELTQPVIVNGKVFVASTNDHTVHALSAGTGKEIWTYTAGGRIDSSPTIYNGAIFFGSADGWVYCLDVSDGKLAWRFRGAPQERQVMIYDQLESSWPIHGAVLIQNDKLYFTAGRSTYLDCGIVLYKLDPMTGKQLAREVASDIDPETSKQSGYEKPKSGDMAGSTTDILSGDGESVFMKHLHFDESCKLTKAEKPHLFSITGFLNKEWFVRSYWIIGTDVGAGWGGWASASNQVPFGKILCYNDENVYGYGRKKIAGGPVGHKLDDYQLFASPKLMISTKPMPKNKKSKKNKKANAAPQPQPKPKGKLQREKKQNTPSKSILWADTASPVIHAMAITSDKLIVAGPPSVAKKNADVMAFTNQTQAHDAWSGEMGALLQVVDASNGKKLSEYKLPALPVFDGLSTAAGNVYISLKNGTVQCWGK